LPEHTLRLGGIGGAPQRRFLQEENMTSDNMTNLLVSAAITLAVGIAIVTMLVLRQTSKRIHQDEKEPLKRSTANRKSVPDEPSEEHRTGTK
jgi:hypothetical protein